MLKNLKETSHEQCQTNDVWQRRIGEINMLTFVLSLEDLDKEQYDNLGDLVFTDEVPADSGNVLED